MARINDPPKETTRSKRPRVIVLSTILKITEQIQIIFTLNYKK